MPAGEKLPSKRTRGVGWALSEGGAETPGSPLDTRQAAHPRRAGWASGASPMASREREGQDCSLGGLACAGSGVWTQKTCLVLALLVTPSRWPGSVQETPSHPRAGARWRGGSSPVGPRRAVLSGCPAGPGRPAARSPAACAPVGPGRVGRLPAAPGRPLRTPGAGGVAAPRGPRGHPGDPGGGLAAAPRRSQRGPDLPEAPDRRPPQVRGCGAAWRSGRGRGRGPRGGGQARRRGRGGGGWAEAGRGKGRGTGPREGRRG